MTPFWQTIIALSLCLVAAAYITLRAYRALAKRSGGTCGGGGCHSCSSNSDPTGAKIKTLLPLEPPSPPGRGPG